MSFVNCTVDTGRVRPFVIGFISSLAVGSMAVALIPIALEPRILRPEICDMRNLDGSFYLKRVELDGNEEPWYRKTVIRYNARIRELCGRD